MSHIQRDVFPELIPRRNVQPENLFRDDKNASSDDEFVHILIWIDFVALQIEWIFAHRNVLCNKIFEFNALARRESDTFATFQIIQIVQLGNHLRTYRQKPAIVQNRASARMIGKNLLGCLVDANTLQWQNEWKFLDIGVGTTRGRISFSSSFQLGCDSFNVDDAWVNEIKIRMMKNFTGFILAAVTVVYSQNNTENEFFNLVPVSSSLNSDEQFERLKSELNNSIR